MSKRTKPNHNPRNPNICRTCKINTIGKNRMALGHNVCQACSKREVSVAEKEKGEQQ